MKSGERKAELERSVVGVMRSLLAVALSVAPLSASGYALPMVRTGPPDASVQITGAAEVRDVGVTVRCTAQGLFERGARCEVTGRFEVVALEQARVVSASLPGESVGFDGTPGVVARTLAAGERTRVTVSAVKEFETATRIEGSPWVFAPMVIRHPFLGESAVLQRREGSAAVVLFAGPSVTVVGDVALDADGARRVVVSAGAATIPTPRRGRGSDEPTVAESERRSTEQRVTVGMSIAPRPSARGPLRNGGPVLAMGARLPLSGQAEPDRFLLRGAWEASLWEYLFVSASVETDFDSVFESVVVDVASPSVAIVVPSFRAGVGLVARQLGPRPADFALRLRAGGNFFPLGADVDLDYWPSIDGWTLSVTGRMSP